MIATHQQELNLLTKLGFPVNPLNQSAKTLDQIWLIAKEIETQRERLNYPIDGLVVKLDDNQLKEELGVVGKTPRGWCAIKFSAEEVVTKIVGISWQVGRTGKVTPVADLEPVALQGTIVKRATLHNFARVKELQLRQDQLVVIRKAGDIIPEVVQAIN
jgi:DNA ligase (NAD+)